MPHVVATYRYAAGSDAARGALRPAHRTYLAGLDGLLLSGPTQGPRGDGAVLVFEAGSASDVEGWLDGDPFVSAGGIVQERSVEGWTVVLGRAKHRLSTDRPPAPR